MQHLQLIVTGTMAEVQGALDRRGIRWKSCSAFASTAIHTEVHVLVEEHYAVDVERWFSEPLQEAPFLHGTLLYIHSLERREALTDHTRLFASRRFEEAPCAFAEGLSP
jgi:hypothetical protein